MAPIDMTPILPPTGSPDDPAAGPRAPEAAATAPVATWAIPAPVIAPAVPAAWTKTVSLDHALIVDGVTLSSVTIRRPTGADVAELMEQDPDEGTLPLRLRAWICGVHPAVFTKLWADDSERVAEAIVPFLPTAVREIERDQEPAEASA